MSDLSALLAQLSDASKPQQTTKPSNSMFPHLSIKLSEVKQDPSNKGLKYRLASFDETAEVPIPNEKYNNLNKNYLDKKGGEVIFAGVEDPNDDEDSEKSEDETIKVSFANFPKRPPFSSTGTVNFNSMVTPTLQQAIDNANNGATLIIPAGVYNEEIILTKNIHIKGQGNVIINGLGVDSTCTVKAPHTVIEEINFVQIDTKGGGALTVQKGYCNAINCTFKAVTISAVQVMSNSHCELENCLLEGSYNPCLMCMEKSRTLATKCTMQGSTTFGVLSDDTSSLTLEECFVAENKGSGISAISGSNLLVRNCDIKKNESCGIECSATGSIVIHKSRIEDHEDGTGLMARGNVKILCVENSFRNNQLANVKAQEGAIIFSKKNEYSDSDKNVMILSHDNATIDCYGDHITGKAVAAVAAFDSGKLIMRNSRVENISGPAIIGYNSGEVLLEDVDIFNIASSAIQLRDKAAFVFQNVTINGFSSVGISLFSDTTGQIKNCKVLNGSSIGMEMSNCSAIGISNTTIASNAIAGVSIHDNCMAEFSNCIFESNGKYEVDITGIGASPIFAGCKFSGSLEALASITYAADPIFSESVFCDCPKVGLSVISALPGFTQCEITRIGSAAVSVSGQSRAVFEECKVHDNFNFAVQVWQSETQAGFTKSHFYNNTRSVAIMAYDYGFVQCTECTFKGSLQPHLEIKENASAQLTQCDLSSTIRGVGIQVYNGGDLQLTDTKIHHEPKIGLVLGEKGSCTVSGGSFEKCGQAGIVASGDCKLSVSNCTFDGNGQFSMQCLSQSKVEIHKCTIKNHSMFGLVISRPADVTYNEIEFSNNGQEDVFKN